MHRLSIILDETRKWLSTYLTHSSVKTSPLLHSQQQCDTSCGRQCYAVHLQGKGHTPEIDEDSKVYCSGELVMTTGGTKKEYVVDLWSGNHPFYLENREQLLVDADQVEKFRQKFSGLTQIMEIPVLKGEIVLPPKKKSGKGKKK